MKLLTILVIGVWQSQLRERDLDGGEDDVSAM